jgi:hypothetical protein
VRTSLGLSRMRSGRRRSVEENVRELVWALTRAASRSIFLDHHRVGQNQEVSRSDRRLHPQGSSGADMRVAGVDARSMTPSVYSGCGPRLVSGFFIDECRKVLAIHSIGGSEKSTSVLASTTRFGSAQYGSSRTMVNRSVSSRSTRLGNGLPCEEWIW